jgi:hypothetical protein
MKHHPNDVPSIYNPSMAKQYYVINPYTISGSANVCDYTIYTIQNKPASATVTWRYSSNLSNYAPNGTTNDSIRFYPSGGGAGWIEATVRINGVDYNLPRKNVSVYGFKGTYGQSGATATLKATNALPNYTQVTINLEALSSGKFTWTPFTSAGYSTPSSWSQNASGTTLTFVPGGKDNAFTATISNSPCANRSTTFYFNVNSGAVGGSGCEVIYNPNTDILDIQFNSNTEVQSVKISRDYQIKLVDFYGNLVKEGRSSGENISWNLSNLRNNTVYIIHVYDTGENLVKTLKISK